MSETGTVKAGDGHILGVYIARPEGKPMGGLVVLQEIFGVNRHIRSVADGFARDGFLAVAPSLFDRIEKNVELTYEGEDAKEAMSLLQRTETLKAPCRRRCNSHIRTQGVWQENWSDRLLLRRTAGMAKFDTTASRCCSGLLRRSHR